MIREIEYLNIPNCIEISNGVAKVVVPAAFGPRVLFYGLDGGENVFGWHPEAAVNTELGTWKPYGGHRLWMAPENMPLSYTPDNEPIEHEVASQFSVTLTGLTDSNTKLQKVMTVTLEQTGSGVTVDHRIKNSSSEPMELSAWALTIMRPGGVVVIPNEPFRSYGPGNLLPVRSIAQWSYTDLADPRWSLGKDAIRLRVDENIHSQQKIGVLNKQGWVAYELGDLVFTKHSSYIEGVIYPDLNSNFEVYTDGGFVEIESLSPLKTIEAGGRIKHRESWGLKEVPKA